MSEEKKTKKVLYVATVVKTHIMEFHIPYLKMLKDMGWETAVAARNDYENPEDCVIPYCDIYYDVSFERNPFKPGNLSAYKQLKQIIDEGDYDIIHCHTPVGGMLTRLAARKARKSGCKVFYTAHGFHFYKGAPMINWIAYYPVEKWLARKTDVLITITREDFERAKRFKARRIEYIPGIGVDMTRFKKGDKTTASSLKENLGIPSTARVLLSVGEVNKNKNHQMIVRALPSFVDTWFVLCGRGPLVEDLRRLAISLGVNERVIFAGYRTDVVDFYSMADVFVFPSFREGLPVALMEAMSTEVVCVASRNRGTKDLMENSHLLFDAGNLEEMKTRIKTALETDCSDEVMNNKAHLASFDLSNTLSKVRSMYLA